MADWLLETALGAISSDDQTMSGWCADKLREHADADRLKALRFVCSSLDAGNREVVAAALGVSFDDLEACGRVLRAI